MDGEKFPLRRGNGDVGETVGERVFVSVLEGFVVVGVGWGVEVGSGIGVNGGGPRILLILLAIGHRSGELMGFHGELNFWVVRRLEIELDVGLSEY